MKRLATLVLMAGLSLGAVLAMGRGASATPFSDVPANHWAYQALQSLAADGLVEGYPDGKFKGDRPLSRYEMAVIVARVIAKVEANGASKADLDKLQKLIQALKDELDALGVRVTNLEDSLDALDKRTKFAQSIQFHGLMIPVTSFRNEWTVPTSIGNGTGVSQPVYSWSAGGGGTAAVAAPGLPLATVGADPIVTAFINTDPSNSALTAQGAGQRFRYDDRFTFIYAVSDNLTVSIPFHLVSYVTQAEFQNQTGNFGSTVTPGVDIAIKKSGNLTNLLFRFGILDNMKSSRTGLTYQAPDINSQGPAFENPASAYNTGFQVGGTLNGLTDFQFNYTRLAPQFLNTQAGVQDSSNVYGYNGTFFTVSPPQSGYTQTGAPGSSTGALTSNTFNAGNGELSQVYLSKAAQIGTVYISQYNGVIYNSNGVAVGGGTGAPPAFVYNQSYNNIIFTSPLPAGSSVTISYVGLGLDAVSTNWQRYEFNGRVNQKIKGLPGAEVGVSFNRIFDYGTTTVVGPAATSGTGNGLISDSVLGIDFQSPIPISMGAGIGIPVIFGEAAGSKFTPDYTNTPATTDTAGVIGLRLKIDQVALTFQYQSVGPNFLDGAPYKYYGQAPPTFSYWKEAYFPSFFGFGNNYGVNCQFEQQFGASACAPNGGGLVNPAVKNPLTAENPNLTYITPVFNPFSGGGPQYFSSFIPNTRGVTGTAQIPFRIATVKFNAGLTGQYLSEIRPFSTAEMQFGPAYASNQLENFTKGAGNLAFTAPVFTIPVAFNLGGTVERLLRNDLTPYQYYPFNPATQTLDPTSVAYATQLYGAGSGTYSAGGSQVSWTPNYVNLTHWQYTAGVTFPIQKQLALTLNYDSQRYAGTYATINSQTMNQRKDQYQAAVTYAIPNTNSNISFLMRQNKYTDYVLPTYNFNQSRQDLTFTVRF